MSPVMILSCLVLFTIIPSLLFLEFFQYSLMFLRIVLFCVRFLFLRPLAFLSRENLQTLKLIQKSLYVKISSLKPKPYTMFRLYFSLLSFQKARKANGEQMVWKDRRCAPKFSLQI